MLKKMLNWFTEAKNPKPPKLLIAVSKPGTWGITSGSGKSKTNKEQVTINLYMQGVERSWDTTPPTKLASQDLDFWVKTGKWPSPGDADNFEWILSLREQKKKLLAELIAMDVDKESN